MKIKKADPSEKSANMKKKNSNAAKVGLKGKVVKPPDVCTQIFCELLIGYSRPSSVTPIKHSEVKDYKKDPWGWLARRFDTTEEFVRAYCAYAGNDCRCTGTNVNGKQCQREGDDPELRGFVPGFSDRCSKHKGKRLEDLKH
jgi:hypothetical protein